MQQKFCCYTVALWLFLDVEDFGLGQDRSVSLGRGRGVGTRPSPTGWFPLVACCSMLFLYMRVLFLIYNQCWQRWFGVLTAFTVFTKVLLVMYYSWCSSCWGIECSSFKTTATNTSALFTTTKTWGKCFPAWVRWDHSCSFRYCMSDETVICAYSQLSQVHV